uniref:C2H2-type domain-containing protein n=1 Tax=Arion vulgaris TaxID=1028688 RepID=A0A0B7B314_9EUPU
MYLIAEKTNKKKASSRSIVEQSIASTVDPKSTGSCEPKALICSYEGCNRKFAWLNHLKYHELTHTNNRQYKCPEDPCGKTFFTAQRLSVHQRTHTGEKPFRCPQQDCAKTFTTAGNLKNHQRIHTGEQPFVCDHLNCSRRFTEQSSLRKHKLTHSGDKPFECNICGKKFTQSGSRRQHLIRHHLDDEIRQSFKQEIIENDIHEDEVMDEERKAMSISNVSCGSHTLQTESSTINAVSCSPQVLVLNNAYPGESIVLSHGLSDHIVTVKAEVLDNHPLSGSQSISLSHTLLSSDGLHDGVLHGRSDDFVVLPETSIYEHDDNPGDIVYATNILDHEEVTHADFVNSHVDYSGEIVHSNYSSHRELTNGDDFAHSELSHSDTYMTHSGDIAVTEYASTVCTQHLGSFAGSKTLPNSYLDSDRDIAHTEFIGAEEVAIAQYSNISTSLDLAAAESVISDCSQRTVLLRDSMTENFQEARKVQSEFSLGETTFISHSSCHPDLPYVTSTSDCDQSVVVVQVTNHTIGAGQVDREIHMDPMMECDEEPERHQFLVSPR